IVKDSLDAKTVGTDFPQAYNFIKEYNPDGMHAIFELYKYHTEFPDFTPDLSGIMLSGRAKLTDFVSNGFTSNSKIISPRTKEILEKFNLCRHRFYDMILHVRKVPYKYYWMHIISDYSDFVDYKETTFFEKYVFSKRGNQVKADSKKELLEKREILEKNNPGKYVTIWGDNIVMNSEFNKELDFFEICIIDGSLYVSERLKEEIIRNNLTGLEFIPAEKLCLSD
ncbi:MAG: hypothetical protein LBK94_10410, partial [Prevotellaceae bacterium]|nr:hypothetical protein [Prevotellaceae bacterium]